MGLSFHYPLPVKCREEVEHKIKKNQHKSLHGVQFVQLISLERIAQFRRNRAQFIVLKTDSNSQIQCAGGMSGLLAIGNFFESSW